MTPVSVRLFARARDLAGTSTITVDLPEAATVADLRQALVCKCPALGTIARSLLVAIGTDYASDAAPITPGAEVACFPPVSGG
jgi:sulfur-carrier protein